MLALKLFQQLSFPTFGIRELNRWFTEYLDAGTCGIENHRVHVVYTSFLISEYSVMGAGLFNGTFAESSKFSLLFIQAHSHVVASRVTILFHISIYYRAN